MLHLIEYLNAGSALATILQVTAGGCLFLGGWAFKKRKSKQEAAEAFEQGLEQGIQEALGRGTERGRELGMKIGLEQGLKEGIAQGAEEGRKQGIAQGLAEGKTQGKEIGLSQGRLEVANALVNELKANGVETAELGAEPTGETIIASLKTAYKKWATKLPLGQRFYDGQIYHITDHDKILSFDHMARYLPGSGIVDAKIDGERLHLVKGDPTRSGKIPGYSLLLTETGMDVDDSFRRYAHIAIRKDTDRWDKTSEEV